MARKPLDWTKTGTVHAMAEWLRKDSDAFAVVVIRRDDAVLVVHPEVTPRDAQNLVADQIGDLAVAVDAMRRGQKKDGRVELGPLSE
jgi:hypothetical protein